MTEGFFRVAAAVPAVEVGNPEANANHIIDSLREAKAQGVDLVVMPELCISGYTCGELFHQEQLLLGSEKALLKVAEATAGLHAAVVVGVPLRFEGTLYN